jgi:uncharacterized protein YbjT (DUF2867 family)
MIVVTGATGQAGSEVVRALAARGDRLRAFVRDPGPARRKLGEDVELAAGDLADPRSVRAALDGADTLFLSCADLHFTIDDLIAEDDRVTIRWTLRGTNTGPMLGRPPTGQPIELAAIVIFRIADGKIAERWAAWKPGRAPFP